MNVHEKRQTCWKKNCELFSNHTGRVVKGFKYITVKFHQYMHW